MMNAIDYLKDIHRDPRLHEVVVALGGEMLLLGGIAESVEDGWAMIDAAIGSGRAAEHFARMVAALGGPSDLLERPGAYLPKAAIVRPILPLRTGFVSAVDARGIGVGVIRIGGGRTRAEDRIDHAVGFTSLAGHGDPVGPDAPLGIVHARTVEDADAAEAALRAAYTVSDEAAEPGPVVLARFAASEQLPEA